MKTHEAEQKLSVLIFYATADKKESVTIPLPLAIELDLIAGTLARIEKEIERKDR